MDILFSSKKLERLCLDDALATRTLGRLCARKLRSRLDDLRAAVNLAYAARLPGRFHPFQADSDCTFALYLHADHRLVICPAQRPMPKLSDGTLNFAQVTIITVTDIDVF